MKKIENLSDAIRIIRERGGIGKIVLIKTEEGKIVAQPK